jgi:predicted GH43/DUF377 family glycosyl hydrolase
LYHANDSREPHKYKLGAMILDKNDPEKILYRTSHPILNPDMPYENDGKPGVVYASGAVVIGERLFIYYGGADRVVCAASASLDEFLTSIKKDVDIQFKPRSSIIIYFIYVCCRRSEDNPILTPHLDNPWESFAVFNGCPIETKTGIHLLYRAMSHPEQFEHHSFSLSTVGIAHSKDGIHFKDREQFLIPELEWERYGCEDPRVTEIDGRYYIFYTALSTFPFSAPGIRVGLAISDDMETITEKHPITPFNAKAMSLFPKKIGGKFTAILTAHTDLPPSKIAIAQFDQEEDMWSEKFWKNWHDDLDSHILELRRNPMTKLKSAHRRSKQNTAGSSCTVIFLTMAVTAEFLELKPCYSIKKIREKLLLEQMYRFLFRKNPMKNSALFRTLRFHQAV